MIDVSFSPRALSSLVLTDRFGMMDAPSENDENKFLILNSQLHILKTNLAAKIFSRSFSCSFDELILTTIPFQPSGECQYSNYSFQLDVKLT